MEKLKGKKPSIRFPEFKDDWEFKNGGNVFETVSNKNHNSDLPILAISQEFGAVPREMINYQISVTEKSVASYKVVDVGDYIISLRSFQGGIEYSNYKGICSPAYIILRPFIEIDRDFFRYYFKTYKYIQQLNSKLEGIRDGKMISYKYFSEIPLPFPTLPEQKRIAAFFTVVDKKIAELKQKKALLEKYKKGVMQKLFSQESRFKDENGKEFPKWEKKRLGNVASFFSGGTPVTTKKSYYDGEIPFIKSGEINSDKTEQFITEEGLKNSSAKMVEIGDLLYALYGATSGEAGISKIKGAINQAVLCIRTEIYNKIFLLNYLQFEKTAIVGKYLQGGQGNLSADIVKSLIVSTPCSAEQDKISDFLSAIDEKIIRTENQIQQTQEWKKGLLQNMCVNG